ncbi:MAG TPA: ABC transporter permease [Candidatus Saccharimonadales bacterium]|nr:ABC transporter permease [Candidatus Saccharimonadales bacterium]
MAQQLEAVQNRLKYTFYSVQNFAYFSGRVLALCVAPPIYWRDLYEQLHFIGVGSLYLVLLSAFFSGQALAIQLTRELQSMGSETYLGKLMVVAVVRALGPTLTGLVVAARCSSGITAEIGAMKGSNQIDALTAFGTDPLRKLAVPRVYALLVMLPCLTLISDLLMLYGGALISIYMARVSMTTYWSMVRAYMTFANLTVGMVKPVAYSFVISLVACYQGFTSSGGTRGVGRSTTQSVVIASVSILVGDAVLTRWVFAMLGW